MSQDAVADDFDDDVGVASSKKFSGKKLVLFIVLPILLLAGAGAGLMFSGILGGEEEPAQDGGHAAAAEPHEAVPPASIVFYDLPEMIVNLNSEGRRPTFLKIRVSLELASAADKPRLESLQPRIIDNFQVYLRELRLEDLRGSAGIYRLREELLARVNAAVHPAEVTDVLFKEVLVQ